MCCCTLAACATAPTVRTGPSTLTHTGIAAVDALYDRLAADTVRYNAGIDSMARGDADAGRQAITAARTDMLDAASRCQATPPCDGSHFIAAYDALLTRQASELGNEGEDFTAVEDNGNTPKHIPTDGSPVIGWFSTPALTSED